MDRPTKIKIGPLNFEVRYESIEWGKAEKAFGMCTNNEQLIQIEDHLKPDRLACVFLHEVMHALQYITVGHLDNLDREQAADIGSYQAVGFWRDNPEVFRWWFSLIDPMGLRGDIIIPAMDIVG